MADDTKLNRFSVTGLGSFGSSHGQTDTGAEDSFSALSRAPAPLSRKTVDAGAKADFALPKGDKLDAEAGPAKLDATQNRIRFQMNTLKGWMKSQEPADNEGYRSFKENSNIQMHNLITELDAVHTVAKGIKLD